jgi:acetyl esterase/lipase
MHSFRLKVAFALLAALTWSVGHARNPAQATGRFCNPPSGSTTNPLPANMCFQLNAAYGSDALQKFDVYMPATPPHGAPVIFVVHGGGWYQGDKMDPALVRNKVEAWVRGGAILISINYRLVPRVDPLDQALDVAQALAYAQAHAAEWGGDQGKFILMGHSAGGHLVSLLAAQPALATSLGAKPWLGTIALDSAVYDVPAAMNNPSHPALYDFAFGSDAALWNAASPTTQLRTRMAPFLAVCTPQVVGSCTRAQDFVAKASSYGAETSVLEEDLSHEQVNEKLGTASSSTTLVSEFMAALSDGTLK